MAGVNYFDRMDKDLLLKIFNECSAQSVGRLSVCCQDFNTLLKDRIAQSKTIYTVEKKIKKPFSEAVNLQRLDLNDNQISDITPLSALVRLKGLGLKNNQISDRTPLDNLSVGFFTGCRIVW
eukprot:COSAG03_NODE_10372_length_655_cov_0.406475_1_plen_122_part_00